MKQGNREPELNQTGTTLPIFMAFYNQNLPTGFPRASVKTLQEFQVTHPLLFKKGDEWSIDRHRKRLMDWLASHRDAS